VSSVLELITLCWNRNVHFIAVFSFFNFFSATTSLKVHRFHKLQKERRAAITTSLDDHQLKSCVLQKQIKSLATTKMLNILITSHNRAHGTALLMVL